MYCAREFPAGSIASGRPGAPRFPTPPARRKGRRGREKEAQEGEGEKEQLCWSRKPGRKAKAARTSCRMPLAGAIFRRFSFIRVIRGRIGPSGLGPANPFRIMTHPLRILVVEDEKALAHIIAMMLGGPASKVTTARNGWEALIKIGLAARPFDVVITDHRMPRVTGLELVRHLRTKNFGGKILVLSAHLADEEIRAYEELNVDMMMTKPFDFDELQQAMAVLDKKASVLAEA